MAQVSTRVLAALAALSLAAPALAACSDDPPSGSPPPTSSSSSSPTGSATPSGPPALPAAARGRTPQAAEAFVRYYVDLINYGLETLDSEPLRAASAPDCDLCLAFADALDTLRQREGFYEGGRWTIRRVRRIDSAEPAYVFEAAVRISKERIVQRNPKGESTHPARATAYVFRVNHDGAPPKIIDLQGVAE